VLRGTGRGLTSVRRTSVERSSERRRTGAESSRERTYIYEEDWF
jgi:hypothetical protein